MKMRLENAGGETLPRRPSLHLLTLAVDQVPVELTTAGINIHLSGPEPSLALPEVSTNPEGGDDEGRKVRLEELRGSTGLGADGRDSSVELWNVSLRNNELRKGEKRT